MKSFAKRDGGIELRGRPPYRGLTADPDSRKPAPRAYTGPQPVSGAGRKSPPAVTVRDPVAASDGWTRCDSGTDRESRDERERARSAAASAAAVRVSRPRPDRAVEGRWTHTTPTPITCEWRSTSPCADGATCRPTRWWGRSSLAGDEVVGRGWYEGPSGAPHAEVRALREAGDRARGATIVCTLEPCDHHGATPPCTEALIDAGVARVVVGATDPNPLVDGSGFARLRAAGLDVRDGVLAAEAHRLNAAFERHVTTGTPVRDLEGGDLARRQDGRARRLVALDHLRRRHGATRIACVRGRTRSSSAPARSSPTTRRSPARHPDLPDAWPPLRVVVDGAGRVPATAAVFDGERAHTGRDDRRRRPSPRPRAGRPGSRSRCCAADGTGGVSPTALLDDAREARRARCRAGRRCDPRVELPARRRRRPDRAVHGAPPDRRRRAHRAP